jgi:hypothetical protein
MFEEIVLFCLRPQSAENGRVCSECRRFFLGMEEPTSRMKFLELQIL